MKTVKVMISPFYNGGPWTDKKSGVGFHPKRDFGKVMKINAEDISGIEASIRYNRLLPIEGFDTTVPTPPAPPVNPEFIGTKATSDYLGLSFDRPVFPVAGRTITLVVDGVERTLLAESGDLKGHVIGYKVGLGKTYALSVNEGVFVDKNNYTVSSFQVTEKGITDKPVIVDPESVEATPISINPTEGDSGTIAVKVNPDNATDKSVTFTSSAPTIITVDGAGKWTAVKAGNATITVKTANDKQATVTVSVKQKIIDPTGVTPNPASLNPFVGETATITATVAPANATNKNVTWSSSDATIVSVDNTGKWNALKVGSANITVKTVNNVQAVVPVTVKPIAVTGVTASPKTVTGEVGAKAKITATVAPANATNKAVTWSSSDATVATITNTGDYTLVKEGTATFTVKTTDGNKTDTVAVTVTAAPTEPEVKVASAPKKRATKKKVEESAE